MQPVEPHWTAYLSALLVPLVALIAVGIAYQQWQTARKKLVLDLFDRRFAVYDAARQMLASVLTSGSAKDEEVIKYLSGTREAKWLFDESLAEYFDKDIYHKLVELQMLKSELEGVPVGPERSQNVERQRVIKTWLQAQYEELDRRCSPYLRLQH
jgi:hypothetical protein